MQIKVKNREALLSHGDAEGRKIVLDITEKTLQQLDAYERIKRITHMEGDELCIGSRRWDLSKKRNVYLLGAGKACNHMAMAIDEILGDYLTRGIAIVKISEPTDVFHKTEVYVGGHPLPNAEGAARLQGDHPSDRRRHGRRPVYRRYQRRLVRAHELPDRGYLAAG